MPHQTRTPSTKIILNKDIFNQLIYVLDKNSNLKLDKVSEFALKIKEKLLKYSVIRTNDDGEEIIDIRFFPNESSLMIYQLLLQIEKLDGTTDYYSQLKENK